jgi:hypothetical protein
LQKDGNSRKFKRKEEGLYTETKRRRQKSKDRKKKVEKKFSFHNQLQIFSAAIKAKVFLGENISFAFQKNSSFATNKTSDEDKGSGQMQIFDRKKVRKRFHLN